MSGSHASSLSPLTNQLLPLSARMRPYCFIAVRITAAAPVYCDTSKLALRRTRRPMRGQRRVARSRRVRRRVDVALLRAADGEAQRVVDGAGLHLGDAHEPRKNRQARRVGGRPAVGAQRVRGEVELRAGAAAPARTDVRAARRSRRECTCRCRARGRACRRPNRRRPRCARPAGTGTARDRSRRSRRRSSEPAAGCRARSPRGCRTCCPSSRPSRREGGCPGSCSRCTSPSWGAPGTPARRRRACSTRCRPGRSGSRRSWGPRLRRPWWLRSGRRGRASPRPGAWRRAGNDGAAGRRVGDGGGSPDGAAFGADGVRLAAAARRRGRGGGRAGARGDGRRGRGRPCVHVEPFPGRPHVATGARRPDVATGARRPDVAVGAGDDESTCTHDPRCFSRDTILSLPPARRPLRCADHASRSVDAPEKAARRAIADEAVP